MSKPLEEMTPEELGQWLVSLCLAFGCQPSTAFTVAGIFLAGLERDRERLDP